MLIHSEKSLAKNYTSVHQDLSPTPSQARFQLNQPHLPPPPAKKSKGKSSPFKKGKNRWKVGSIIAFVAIAWSALPSSTWSASSLWTNSMAADLEMI
jgi:hypothetical protein